VLGPEGGVRIGTAQGDAAARRRIARIDGRDVATGALAAHIRPIWLTPAQDRLFLDAAADRRRFLDRLVFAAEPAHAADVTAYERALRERLRLLTDGPADAAWLTIIEARIARAGAAISQARARTVEALRAMIASRETSAFPKAALTLTGDWETMAAQGASADALGASMAEALAKGRPRDAAAGKSLVGPHRCDLEVIHVDTGRAAAQCSTGEQKALILNVVLAQAARLSGAKSEANPVLLLDEVAAHLDQVRRAALFDEIEALSLQAFLTGTDEMLFDTLRGRAVGVHVEGSRLALLDD
jgi:DNA replication and repair protein RecF